MTESLSASPHEAPVKTIAFVQYRELRAAAFADGSVRKWPGAVT